MPLLQTKFYTPPLRTEFVPRLRLLEQLDAEGKLTLISAPAGFGKTTMASCWLATRKGWRVAWVSLDENDNDPLRFLAYLITALHRTDPAIGQATLDILQSPNLPPIPILLSHLINDLAQSTQHFILTLDDYHLIQSPAIHNALTFLLENMPPQLHLVIISRTEPPLPIAKLRAKNQITELHAHDLRFTWAEAETFLNQTMKLGLSGEQITQLETCTEGWITGLQLTALSLNGTDDTAHLVKILSGDNRYVADYLVDEVLSLLPEPIQEFLLRTSVLNRLCADLCNEVTGIENSQDILETLEKTNLFIISLDETRRWYRYHHLFAQMLRSRLEKRQGTLLPQLYRRAFEWHHKNNLLEDAVKYALAGEMFEQAARIIEAIGAKTYWQNHAPVLREWLQLLPKSVFESRPGLQILYTYGQINKGDMQSAEQAIKKLQHNLPLYNADSPETHRILEGQLAAVSTAVAFHRHLDLTYGEELAHQALTLLPSHYHYDRCVAAFHGAGFLILLGKLEQANQYLQEALVLSDRADSPVAQPLILSNLGHLATTSGNLQQAKHYYQQACDFAQHINVNQNCTFSGAVIGLASLYYQWNDLPTASTYLEQGLELVERDEFLDRLIFAYLVAVKMYCTQHQFDRAHNILQRATRSLKRYKASVKMQYEIEILRAETALAEKDFSAVEEWITRFAAFPEKEKFFGYGQALNTIVNFLVAKRDYQAAINQLIEPLKLAQGKGQLTRVIQLKVLSAKVHYLQNNQSEALVHLQEALTLAQPENPIRVFLDEGESIKALLRQLKETSSLTPDLAMYVQTLLKHFHAEPVNTSSTAESPIASQLTPRELEVLNHLASGLTYAEIADRLVITKNTLKYHIKNIYSKLGVKNRTKAIAAAKNLNL